MGQIILDSQNLINRIKYLCDGFEQSIRTSSILEMTPKAFNGIKVATIRWQPHCYGTVLKVGEHGLAQLTFVIRGIVHDQYNRSLAINCGHQMLNKGRESHRVFLLTWQSEHLVSTPIISSYQMMPLCRARCRNPFLLPTFHPTLDQCRKQP